MIGPRDARLLVECECHIGIGLGPAPHGDGLPLLENHVIGEDGRYSDRQRLSARAVEKTTHQEE